MKLSKDAVELLRRVEQHILANPERIAMGCWRVEGKRTELWGLKVPECGTVACIGGWVEMLSEKTGLAESLLGIGGYQSWELFFKSKLVNASNQQTLAHAIAVSKHIDKFIKKYS